MKKFYDRFHLVLDDLIEGCSIIGFDWKVLYLNSAAAQHRHLNVEEILDHTMYQVYPDFEQSEIFAPYLKCMTERIPLRFETSFTFVEGITYWYELSVQPTEEGIFVLSVDISDRKRTQEKLDQLYNQVHEITATKDKLYSIIAHDLRSPFNGILGFSELLSENIKDHDIENSKFITEIISTAKHTLNLLDNLLAWSKMQTSQIDFKPVNLYLNPIIHEVMDELNSSALLKNISLKSMISEDKVVYADPHMLRTILRNLVSNAIKFSNSGGSVNINAISEQNQIEIIVSENGVGMSEETYTKLFRFETTETTAGTANERGSGLGLILCKEFVEKHDGKIWVKSELGKGSEFHFTFPASSGN